MSDEISSLDEFDISELSEEDLAVLKAFEAMDTWPTEQSRSETDGQNKRPRAVQALSPLENEEILLIFTTEAEEDISSLRQTLNQLEQHKSGDLAHFTSLKRAGHKLYGTAGAIGFSLISTIAAQVELLAEAVLRGILSAHTGELAISGATTALEACLETITSTNQEPEAPSLLTTLETAYQCLHIDLEQLEQELAAVDQADSREKKLSQTPSEVKPENEQVAQNGEAQELLAREGAAVTIHLSSEDLQQGSPPTSPIPSIHVDARRFEHLTVSAEKLVEQRAILEDAQRQVECALQELYTAQTRLQRLEPLIAQLQNGENTASPLPEHIPTSSLVARILHQSFPYKRRHQKYPTSPSNGKPLSALEHMNTNPFPPSNTQWDELELEHFNERDMLRHALKEAMADLAITTASVQSAFTHFSMLQQDSLASITHLYRDTLLLRQAAFATIVPRLERVVKMSAPGQAQQIRFDVTGEEIEIDQELLNVLATPLVQLLRICLADPVILEELTIPVENVSSLPPCVWLKVTNHGKRLTFEIGFSMPIQGGAIETIRQPIQQLHGTISLQRNSLGGISFFLHIPHVHSSVFCLLVQAGDQHLLIPFNQIQCISTQQQEQTDARYSLQELLGLPGTRSGASPISANLGQDVCGDGDRKGREGTVGTRRDTDDRKGSSLQSLSACACPPSTQRRVDTPGVPKNRGVDDGFTPSAPLRCPPPLLILNSEDGTMGGGSTGIVVDEILGEQECIVKPLPSYLQRPGIAGTTIDGKGRVLLMVDLLALIRSAPQYISLHQTHGDPLPPPDRAKILVTDDSAALRHSLKQTLQKASYSVFEAHDGIEALEKLQRYKPDICLLDVEMPNLNGYDVLQMMGTDPTLSAVKVIMLTSRSTTKHMQHALELGARAYLTKPCAQDDLFQTIESVMKE